MEVEERQANASTLTRLPPEIIYQIFDHLQCPSLISLLRTCQLLRKHAENETLWANLIKENLPHVPENPFPCTTFRQLYLSQYPYWFLLKYKLWFSDGASTGKLILVSYDARRGSIEGYTLLAMKGSNSSQDWLDNPDVTIHSFWPTLSLHRDRPVIRLPGRDTAGPSRDSGWWEGETPMQLGRDNNDRVYSSFVLSREIAGQVPGSGTDLWPPKTIPSQQRFPCLSHLELPTRQTNPQRYSEISDKAFRLRTWMQFTAGGSAFSVRMGEEISTWSTLDPELYTPTREKPYQGIWVGDYAGHGCEFLLVMQRETVHNERYRRRRSWSSGDADSPGQSLDVDPEMEDVLSESRSPAQDDPAYKGRIEAVKLTGDDNVPRGQYTWIANDIGSAGFIGVASEPFRGARVVSSRGHVAARGFHDDEFVHSQLILQSHSRLAHYWEPLGHVSYYERVNIDALI